MSVKLQKGQKVSLSKEHAGLSKIIVGLGWDEVQQQRSFFAPKPQDIDCDAFALLLVDGKLASSQDIVYYGTTDPELVLEWDYDANERKPTEISRLSQYPVWWKGACGHKWKDKVFCRAVEGARCIYCEKEFVQVLPRLLVMVYAKQCGTKVSISDEKTIGILLDALLPEVNLAFTFPSRETDRGAKVIEVMQYMCAARKIQLIEVREKEPIELAHEIKQAFAKAHLYIDSDSEKEIDYLRKWYFHQTV